VATHFFVTPLVPTFFVDPSVLVFQRINDTDGWNVEWALVCEKDQGAIVYRNATWKAEVGCWLSQCGNSALPVPVVEVSVGTEISLANLPFSVNFFLALENYLQHQLKSPCRLSMYCHKILRIRLTLLGFGGTEILEKQLPSCVQWPWHLQQGAWTMPVLGGLLRFVGL
jgi:hypothetical protein